MHPITLALLGILAYRPYQGKGRVAEWIGHKGLDDGVAFAGSTAAQQLRSMGAGPLAQGLSDLFNDFQQKGLGETVKSWIEIGSNRPLSKMQLEQTLGEDKIAWLLQQTSMSRDELLDELSRQLPATVDQLTPDGHLPSEPEVKRQIQAAKSEAPSASI